MSEKKHILVVEDSVDMQANIAHWLEPFEEMIALTFVNNIKDAEAALKGKTQFAALITDNQVPPTAGQEVTKSTTPGPGVLLIQKLRSGKLRKRNQNILIMFESADYDQFPLARIAGANIVTQKFYENEYRGLVERYVLNQTLEKPPEPGAAR